MDKNKMGIHARVGMIRQLLDELVGMFPTGVNGTGHDIKRRYRLRRGRRGAAGKGKKQEDKS